MDIITRKQALQQNLKQYFTGKPCKRGHISTRQVSNHVCSLCRYEYERTVSVRKKKLIYQRSWQEINRTKVRKRGLKYYYQYREQILEKKKNDRIKDPHAAGKASRDWAKRHPGKATAKVARRKATLLQATPLWSERLDIQKIYEKCEQLTRETGVAHEVDHIIPLRSKMVCGLHCLANLHIITKTENRRKGNQLIDFL